jgi:hypothetical protein
MTDRLRKLLVAWVAFAVFLAMGSLQALAASEPPAQGSALPHFELGVPQDLGARSYLGLSDSGNFTVPQIKAQVVIIQIFSMY